ncbi:MAG: thioredoxin-dependent thiol peroxidase [Anaerolineales bacterium]
MSNLRPGDAAPDFALPDDAGNATRLSDYEGKQVVLFFYPHANTPGCTKEACGFRDDYSAFKRRGIALLGISPDTVRKQLNFKNKFGLPFPLLADQDHVVAERFGVWGLKKMYGREFMGVKRTTFVIDERGTISRVFENVKPEGHSAEVLAALSSDRAQG